MITQIKNVTFDNDLMDQMLEVTNIHFENMKKRKPTKSELQIFRTSLNETNSFRKVLKLSMKYQMELPEIKTKFLLFKYTDYKKRDYHQQANQFLGAVEVLERLNVKQDRLKEEYEMYSRIMDYHIKDQALMSK